MMAHSIGMVVSHLDFFFLLLCLFGRIVVLGFLLGTVTYIALDFGLIHHIRYGFHLLGQALKKVVDYSHTFV